jgi:hypothetical protein
MITPLGELDHEVTAGGCVGPAVFDRVGYAVARQVLDPDTLRKVRTR